MLPTLFAQIKVANTSENILNKIKQIIILLYCKKQIYSNQFNIKMNRIFINSEKSITSDAYILSLNFVDNIDLKRCDKCAALSS